MRIADTELNYWADRFIAAGLSAAMSFERFMGMNSARRERHLARSNVTRVTRLLEEDIPDARVRDGRLIEPLHHKPLRAFGRPWFRLRRGHRGS